jgi:hypothetical protein
MVAFNKMLNWIELFEEEGLERPAEMQASHA